MEQLRYKRPFDFLDAEPPVISKKSRSGTIRGVPLKPSRTVKKLDISTQAIPSIHTVLGQSDMETYNGHVRTPADAIILFEACRLGLLPRVQRRLSEKERQSIKSGSVFVWDEREAGMRRWTDGKSWSASRVSGSFLTYREMEGKRGGNNFGPPLAAVSRAGKTPDSTRGSDSDLDLAGEDGPDGYRYKPDGLMKQSFSITTSSGNHLHLISYYSRAHPAASNLTSPSNDPQLRHIRPQKGMYPESTVHEHQNIPAVTRSPMVSAPYSTVPQMAGYARQGPPQWSPHYNGYNWGGPPSMQQPPQYGYQYGAGGGQYANSLPPPSNGQSPLAHSQSAHQLPASHSSDPQVAGYDPRRMPPISGSGENGMYAYDQRRGPPSTQQQYDGYRQSPNPNVPQYESRESQPQYRGPSVTSTNLAPVQYQGHNSNPANGIQQMQQHAHLQSHTSSPRTQQQPTPATSSHSNTPATPIDPALFAPSPGAQQQPQPNHHSRTPTPGISGQLPINTVPAHTNGISSTSQASTIPSIGAIMNGASKDNVNSPNADARSDRSGDRTPSGSIKKESGPQDIPGDKLGFSEDMRTLKVLDKTFKA
ncbi:hypothetical protein MMC21_001779 [Puttea exsequens]|nr:hypothetical protein [Puttea exsequens]